MTPLDALRVINELAMFFFTPIRESESHAQETPFDNAPLGLGTQVDAPTKIVVVADTLPVSPFAPLTDHAHELREPMEAVDQLLSDHSFLDGLEG